MGLDNFFGVADPKSWAQKGAPLRKGPALFKIIDTI
jgi:hypothetical protein